MDKTLKCVEKEFDNNLKSIEKTMDKIIDLLGDRNAKN